MITSTRFTSVTERTAVMAMMVSVAMTPIYVAGPACMCVPPARPESPIPGRMPSVPCVTPEPVVYHRTINIHRLDDIIRSVNVLIAYYLYGDLVFLVLLYIYRGYILVYILRQYRLENDESFASFAGLHYAQVVYLPVAVEIEVTERAVWIVEHRLELFQVLSLCK